VVLAQKYFNLRRWADRRFKTIAANIFYHQQWASGRLVTERVLRFRSRDSGARDVYRQADHISDD
jgi:hypothetical protein